MSTTSTPSRPPRVQWLIDSRPPSLTWARPSPPQCNQPQLDLIDQEPGYAEPTAGNDRGVRMSTVKARWAARPRRGLPDAQEWSAKLALAITQTLVGQRPVAQLSRWVVDEVLAAISMYQRRSLRTHGRKAMPAALRSVRVQHPDPEVAEVSAHVVIGKRSAAMAFRLEALGDRWLCTALELGAHWRSAMRPEHVDGRQPAQRGAS
ncbi:MAG TPA: Rv3235 family protein [Propionibacteriaceae bacterium]